MFCHTKCSDSLPKEFQVTSYGEQCSCMIMIMTLMYLQNILNVGVMIVIIYVLIVQIRAMHIIEVKLIKFILNVKFVKKKS